MTPVGQTSRWVAASRAMEANQPRPLFDDPFALRLAGDEGLAMLRHADINRGGDGSAPNPFLAIRTRYFDDALQSAVRERHLEQVVLLAAGMDARAFRFEWPHGLHWYEVDRPDVLDDKERLLSDAEPRCTRHVVRADLADDWVSPLRAAGFDPARPAAFLIEGLLVYLTAPIVDQLLATLRTVAAPGSWLATDLPNLDLFTHPLMQQRLEGLRRLGCPWQFGVADPVEFFAAHGWRATHVSPGEDGADFGRWPYPRVPRSVQGVPRAFLVTAERAAPEVPSAI